MVKRIKEFQGEGIMDTLGISQVSSGFEKLGNKAVQGIKRGAEKVEQFGKKAIKKTGEYVDTVLHGRNDYPPNVRELIKKYGKMPIVKIVIDRSPVVKALTSVLNFVSKGAFNERLSKTPYDELFHLRIDITFQGGERIALEKNEVINIYPNPVKKEGGEQREVGRLPAHITLDELLRNGQKIQGNKWFKYSAYNNNCQDFIIAVLKGSGIGTEEDYNFIKQDTKALFKGDSFLRKFANTVTDLGGKVNEITMGSGINKENCVQSVIFSIPEWTKARAIKWLKKHGYSGLEQDLKKDHRRFRQIDPEELTNYNYITKSIGDNIELIIAYKKILSNNKYNKMRPYESDSDSSDSDIEGSGLKRERRIISKLHKLRDEIGEHQEVHGGKIDIGKAFKKLGSTIKKGFNKEIAKPTEKLANKAGKYITAKKGGLATDLIDYGVPAATSAVLGGLAGMATGGLGGVAGSAAGAKLGKEVIAKELHKATGAGMVGGIHGMRGGKIKKKDVEKFFRDIGKKVVGKKATRQIEDFGEKTGKYITSKKGGLATDLIDYGVPAATSAVLGGLAGLATGGNPLAGVAAGAAGSKLGKEVIAKELHKATGAGVKKRGRPPKHKGGDLIHIDIGSHNAKGDIEGEGVKKRGRKSKNASLEQLIENNREKEEREFKDALRIMASDINKEKRATPPPKYSKALGTGMSGCGKFKKGSQEAKDHMARIRAMKGKK
jgi:hypothetical protein